MIEVPAAVYQVEALARRVDFLSVGTNDLAQFLLASDRNNPLVFRPSRSRAPALLQALNQIADAAPRAGNAGDSVRRDRRRSRDCIGSCWGWVSMGSA